MFRLSALFVLLSLGVAFLTIDAFAQDEVQPEGKLAQAIQKTHDLLDERLIDSKQFQKEMPLAKLLEAIEQQLPKDKRISLRIDREAFGDKADEIAATAVSLSRYMGKVSVNRVMGVILANTKKTVDFRLADGEVIVTTPDRAKYTARYDIRGLGESDLLKQSPYHADQNLQVHDGNSKAVRSAIQFVSGLADWLDERTWKSLQADKNPIEIVNGTKLLIRASVSQHDDIASYLASLRKLADLAVIVKAQLYEVDEEFYSSLKKVKRISIEQAEDNFLNGVPNPADDLFKSLRKQKKIMIGDEHKVLDDDKVTLLSRHRYVSCLPSPIQVRMGLTGKQAYVQGVSFVVTLHVSGDRRFVRAKIAENVAELHYMEKAKESDLVYRQRTGEEKEMDVETPFLKETTYAQTLDIPDGGSVLVAVNYRPRSLQEKNRWWVLAVTCRIYIQAEEDAIRRGELPPIPKP